MVMDGYYTFDRQQEIWRQINTLHLSYLEMDESPQKLEQRNKLEDCIKEYLCLAPHNQKFMLHETAEVLHRSASSKKDFSGYKAALGWHAIGLYAANLLTQPWRKEYREIKMYSGYFKHQIDANLVGAEIMFEAMGYKHEGNGVLVLDGPICPDRVITVSQDSLVAYMECQILKAIWEEVSQNFKISWLEVLEFRETHLCSPKQSVAALTYRYHEQQYLDHKRSYSQGTNPYTDSTRYVNSNLHASAVSLPSNHSFPPLTGHMHTSVSSSQIPPQCIYGTNGYYPNNYATYGPVVPQHYSYPVPITYAQSLVKPQYHPNGYCCTNGYAQPPPHGYMCPVPTGQLIELESQNIAYDVPDGANHSRAYRPHASSQNQVPNEVYKLKNSNEVKNVTSDKEPDKDEVTGTFESWDYVYKNLESQGYSKDLGERPDVLSPPIEKKQKHVIKEAKKVKSVEDGVSNLNVADRPLKINEALEKYKDYDKEKSNPSELRKSERKHSDGTQSSSYDNVPLQDNIKKQLPKSVGGTPRVKTLSREKLTEKIDSNKSIHSKTLDNKVVKQNHDSEQLKSHEKDMNNLKEAFKRNNQEKFKNDPNKWECGYCTFFNGPVVDICEICGKSRNKVPDIMEVGGAECSTCTLVNPKNCKVCLACGKSLKDSPTYI